MKIYKGILWAITMTGLIVLAFMSENTIHYHLFASLAIVTAAIGFKGMTENEPERQNFEN